MKNNSHDDHSMHTMPSNRNEYIKFAGVMILILLLATLHSRIVGSSLMQFLESFMGVFFIVFASFKLARLKEFAYGFQSYDLIAKKSLVYAYIYPFMQLVLGLFYILGFGTTSLDVLVIVISLVSGAGVLNSLSKKQKVHCVCLGNVIKLPLSTISFVEDFGMAIMALGMIFLR